MLSQCFSPLAKGRFYLGNIKRLLSKPWCEFEVGIEECRTIFGCAFADGGWHHIIETLKEYDANPTIDYRQTTLFKFLKHFAPSSLCDLVPNQSHCTLSLFTYPWGGFRKDAGLLERSKDALNSRFCGPSDDEFIREEYQRTIKLYHLLKQTGYKPWVFPNSFIGGVFLMRENGERRFVVLQGNHRLAILAHIGYATIQVRTLKEHKAIINEADQARWENVVNGTCSLEAAQKIFNLYFESQGERVKSFLDAF